jgi:hypothetical protein
VKFAKYKGNHGKQVIIKNSNDPKYYVGKGHLKYKSNSYGAKSKGGGKGNGRGKRKG